MFFSPSFHFPLQPRTLQSSRALVNFPSLFAHPSIPPICHFFGNILLCILMTFHFLIFILIGQKKLLNLRPTFFFFVLIQKLTTCNRIFLCDSYRSFSERAVATTASTFSCKSVGSFAPNPSCSSFLQA